MERTSGTEAPVYANLFFFFFFSIQSAVPKSLFFFSSDVKLKLNRDKQHRHQSLGVLHSSFMP